MRHDFRGLTKEQIKKQTEKYGLNILINDKKENFFHKSLHIITEPMFLLLIIAAIIYFLLGEAHDGIVMLIFVIGIISIDIIQEWKTDRTLKALKELSTPKVKVIRDGNQIMIDSEQLVPEDLLIISEGVKIPADGIILECNSLCIDESSLTGEAEGVWKKIYHKDNKINDYFREDQVYAGTLVIQGSAIIQITETSNRTEYGKIGKNISEAPNFPTPLQKQIRSLIKLCTIIAGILFLIVVCITFFNLATLPIKDRCIQSILAGITIAMAMIPEEFPVILTVFLSMGAWRLAKKNCLVRKLPSVETLGAISVLCVDKTGTITMNQMTIKKSATANKQQLTYVMGLACEVNTYDPMEKAMLSYCEQQGFNKKNLFDKKHITSYPFTNDLKMMGHVWQEDDEIIIAIKGSAENILQLCSLNKKEKQKIEDEMIMMSKQGLRVIAIAKQIVQKVDDIPKNIQQCQATFCGLVGLLDPPRPNVNKQIEACNKAGIRVVMITGDNGITAKAIADKIGIPGSDHIMTFEELESLSDEELQKKITSVSIFARVIPEHKMRIVKALQANQEIVAMTGDGVNDAPALKHANIGIAMGKHGSEVSREAADIILMDDNFTTIVDTICDGRRIYDNIQKAIGYIFTIHIPIALSTIMAPLLHIDPISLLILPLHVVILELVIDPTSSIVLERIPAEANIMKRKPRKQDQQIFDKFKLWQSILQGFIMFLFSFLTYYIILKTTSHITLARTMGLGIIIFGSLFLVIENSSEYNSCFTTIKLLIKDKVIWIISLAIFLGFVLLIYTPLHTFFKLEPLSLIDFISVILLAGLSIFWYEVVKWCRRMEK